MTLAPLLDAAPAIPLHALAAMAAFALGIVQFASPKGTLPHRTLGWIWVALMAGVAVSSFWIHQIRLFGPLEPDPPAVDLYADHAGARRVVRSSAQGPRPQDHDDLDLL